MLSSMFLFDDFRIYSSALQASDITSLYQLYSNPGVFIPVLHYSFDQWTSGTTIINEGTLGSSFDATLYNSALVSTTSPPTGTQCLSLTASSSQFLKQMFAYLIYLQH